MAYSANYSSIGLSRISRHIIIWSDKKLYTHEGLETGETLESQYSYNLVLREYYNLVQL